MGLLIEGILLLQIMVVVVGKKEPCTLKVSAANIGLIGIASFPI